MSKVPSRRHLFRQFVATAVLALSLNTTAMAVQAPLFTLKDAQNRTVSLKKQRGNVVYVDFWASWCTPCKQSFPWMNEIQQRYGKKGLRVIAINLDENPKDAERFLQQVPANFTIAYDPSGKVAEKYDLQVMPSSYLVDRKGKLVYLHRGFKGGDKRDMEAHIVKALNSR